MHRAMFIPNIPKVIANVNQVADHYLDPSYHPGLAVAVGDQGMGDPVNRKWLLPRYHNIQMCCLPYLWRNIRLHFPHTC